MKKCILVLFITVISTALYAQTLFVESNNIAVTGAVTAELMLELKTNDNRPLRGNSFICHQIDERYIIAIDLHNHRDLIIQTRNLYDILRIKPYWVNNLRMSISGDWVEEIQILYTLNGRNYTVKISIGHPG